MYNPREPMLQTSKVRTWSVVAAFAMAVLYGSFCSTACAVGALPIQAEHAHCDKCNHARHSNSSHHPAPSDHDCGRHVHPTDFVKAAGAPRVHFISVVPVSALGLLVNNSSAADFDVAASSASGLAPPGRSETPLPEKLSVLRI